MPGFPVRELVMLEALFGIVTVSSLAVYAFIDPEWAIPANTLLLILLAVVNHRLLKAGREAATHAEEVKATAKEAHSELKSMAENQAKRKSDQIHTHTHHTESP